MIIYKITNKINGKIYVGQTRREKSKRFKNYFGSGIVIKKMVKKYGKENFEKEILCECKNQKELDIKEAEYINRFSSNKKYFGYNILPGGSWKDGKGCPMLIPKIAKKVSKKLRIRYLLDDGTLVEEMTRGLREYRNDPVKMEEFKKIMSEAVKGEKNPNYGNYWTEEQKQDNREQMLYRYDGENNPNYGKRWSKKQRESFSIKKSRIVIQYNSKMKEINRFIGLKRAAREVGRTKSHIHYHIMKNKKTIDGFYFSFGEESENN